MIDSRPAVDRESRDDRTPGFVVAYAEEIWTPKSHVPEVSEPAAAAAPETETVDVAEPERVLDAQPKTGAPAEYTVFRAVAAASLLGMIACLVIWRRRSNV